jgi:alpha-ketoglutarate-dependent taurine dioxygenase
MPVARLFTSPQHPVVLTPDGAADLSVLLNTVSARGDEIRSLLKKHGAILFRDFALSGAADFQVVVSRLGAENFNYVGGNSPRTRVLHDVFTATDYPASETISLHNELSYSPAWPKRLFFFSAMPAITGGQTSLAQGVDVMRAMPADILRRLRERRVRYVRHFHPRLKMGKTWQQTYQTEDRDELASILRKQGSTHEWQADGALHVATCCDAFTMHPETGEEVWFNQAEQWHPSALHPALRQLLEPRGQLVHHCEFGDGSPMEDGMLAEIRRVITRCKLLFDWRRGDLLMLDNLLTMHGREPFTGTRKTYAFLSRN